MDERAGEVAALANATLFDGGEAELCRDQAPHLKHRQLRELYGRLAVRVYDTAAQGERSPRVLDLGAGEGAATLPLLQLGAQVTAVDLSEHQLLRLQRRCAAYGGRLEVRRESAASSLVELAQEQRRYDVVVANSFLHHVPDYLGLIEQSVALLDEGGVFFSFQDPMRYDLLGIWTRLFSGVAFASWRVRQGDVMGGLVRRMRRMRGIYRADCAQDNAEYHFVRNGVDQDAIARLLEGRGFTCEVVRYFSTLGGLWQRLGTALGLHNTFGVLAQRRARGL